MPVLKNNGVAAPFFGTRTNFVRGLDPLGLQNTSEATFAHLLPGLNNVTGRIRYYSFYAWLLQQYARHIGSTNPKEQEQFIRRAELTLALLHRTAEEDERAIPGSNYALAMLRETDGATLDLQRGTYNADGSTAKDTYWKYPLGAFGQYYLGSLTEIGLVTGEVSERLYRRTPIAEDCVSGEALADAFEASVPDSLQQLFLSVVRKGKVRHSELDDLREGFNMAAVPRDSEEQRLLLALLLSLDFPLRHVEEAEPTTLRRQTIRHILRAIAENDDSKITDVVFTRLAYERRGLVGGETDECLTGWYYYELNEYWQYACTSILNASLQFLEEKAGSGWMLLPKFTASLTAGVLKEAQKLGIILKAPATAGDWCADAVDEAEIDILGRMKDGSSLTTIAHSLDLIRSIAARNEPELVRLADYGRARNLARGEQNAVAALTRIHTYRTMPVDVFVQRFLMNNIIHRHQYVAFRKMGNSNRSTQKFVIDEGCIRFLDAFQPSFTGPRIRNLLRFLQDLHLLDEDTRLTPSGQTLLNGL